MSEHASGAKNGVECAEKLGEWRLEQSGERELEKSRGVEHGVGTEW